MDSKILQLIESSNPEDRKKAVQMLARMGGPEAIRYLGIIYKQESDSEVKDLAIAAGKYIKKQQTGENASAQVPVRSAPIVEEYVEEDDEDEEIVEEVYEPVVVSGAKQSQAKGLMDRALDLSMHGEKDKAIESISKAFKLNPNLRLDTYYMGVAMDITGMDKDATVRLVTEDEKSRKGKTKEKLKNDGSGSSEEVGWDTALVDLAMYFIVVSAVMIVGLVVIVQVFTAALTTAQACNCNSAGITSTLSFLNSLRGVGVIAIILYGLVVGLLSALFLMLQYVFIHLISTMMLGGDGTYVGLIHRATTPFTVATAFTGIIVVISLYLTLQQVSDITVVQTMMTTGQQPENPIPGLLGLVNTVFGFVFLGWLFNRIGNNYNFGSGKGCVAFFLSNIAFGLVSAGCTFAILSAMPNALSSLAATPQGF